MEVFRSPIPLSGIARDHPIVAILLLASIIPAATSAQDDDAQTIVQRSVEATDRDWQAAPQYDYYQRVQVDGGTRTSHVSMILGSPYKQLTAVNGRPLTAEQEAAEQQKLDQEIARRKLESPEDRAQRVGKYLKERRNDNLLIQQLTQAFDFSLQGERKLDGRDVYVLRATPRSGYRPPVMQAQVLKGMEGTLWVDKTTYQWVKIEAEVIHPVTIQGFLARVEPGTRFELEKAPVTEDIWLPTHFAMRSRSKVFFLVPHKTQEDETYWRYEKAASEPAH